MVPFEKHTNYHILYKLQYSTESSKYYARPQTAVTRGHDLPTHGLAAHQTAAASKHPLCYFSLFSE